MSLNYYLMSLNYYLITPCLSMKELADKEQMEEVVEGLQEQLLAYEEEISEMSSDLDELALTRVALAETKEEQMAFAAKIRASVAEMERNPDTARARQHRAMVDQLASASTLHPAEVDAATRAQQARRTERRAQGKTSDCAVCGGPAASSCGR